MFCRLFTINSWTFFHSVMENCCPSRVFIFSLGRTCSPPAVSYLIYTCSPAAPAQWMGGQDHGNAAGDRQRGTAPHARGSCQSSGKGSACTADSITQDKYLNTYDERNLPFVGGWSCDCTASPSNENWSLQEIGWDERILHNLTCHSLSCYTFGAIKMITVRIEV